MVDTESLTEHQFFDAGARIGAVSTVALARCTMAAAVRHSATGTDERGAPAHLAPDTSGVTRGQAVATIQRERTALGATERRLLARVWPRLEPALPALLAVLYIGLWAATSMQNMSETDLDAFFLPSAQIALTGHPLHIYQTRYDLIYPNANGPFSLLPLTLVAWVAARLGWLSDPHLRRMLIDATFAVFPLLIGRELLLALDRLLPRAPSGIWRWLAVACVTLTPELWHSVLFYGHVEQPLMLWLVLVGVRMLADDRPGRAGIVLGLALLTRSAAGLYLLALVLVLALRDRPDRPTSSVWMRLRAAALVAVGAATTVALGVLPFWLADPKDTVYSLVTFRGLLPVGGGTVWFALNGTPWIGVAQRDDSYAVIFAALIVTLALLLARRSLSVRSRDLYALLGIVALCFPLLMKTLWPYYYLDASIFFTFWWLAGARHLTDWQSRLIWLGGVMAPLAAVALAELSEVVYSSLLANAWTLPWSLGIGALTLALMLAAGVVVLLRDDDQGVRSNPARPAMPAMMDGGVV